LSVCLSSCLITIVSHLCSVTYRLNLSCFRDVLQSFLTFDNYSIRIPFHNWRRTSEGDSHVAVSPGWAPPRIHHKPFRIRRSKRALLQFVYNSHLQDPFESADSKGLTSFKFLPQFLYHQYLRRLLGSVHSKGLITSVESALPKTRGVEGTTGPSIRRIKPVSALPSTGWQICQVRPEPRAFRPETCVSLTVIRPADTSIGCWRTV
jgi:hypothetical protein